MNLGRGKGRIRPAGAAALGCGVASGLLGAAALIALLLAPVMCQTSGGGAGATTRVVATAGGAAETPAQPPPEAFTTSTRWGPVVTCHPLGAVGLSAAMVVVLGLMALALAIIVACVCVRVLLRQRKALIALWPAALMLLALTYLTGFSIGPYLLPSALLGLAAAIAATR